MPTMSMNKVIHLAFRRDLDRFVSALGGALEIAREEMNGLVRDPSAARAAVAREALGDLRAATVQHLDHEEAEIESFYLEHADHPEITAMGREFGTRSPVFAGRFFAWVTDGASPQEEAAFKENVPGPVVAVMSSVWGRGYRKEVAPVWR